MPFVPNANVAMVEFRCLWDDQKVENTLYFDRGSAPGPTQIAELAAVLATWWETHIAPLTSDQVTLQEVVVTSLASETAPSLVYTFSLPAQGGATSPSLPNNTTIAIKFNTQGRGRSSRGRNYIIGLVETVVTNNEVSAVHAAALQAAYQELFLTLGDMTNPWVWVVYSRFADGNPRATGLAQAVSSVSFSDRIVDSQRRRLPGRGR